MKSLFRSFAGGEITPEMLGRLDLGKYQTGLALCRNFITLPHGPAQRRRGFQYIGESRDSTKRVRLIPFAYSAEQTAVLEFSHLAIRIFINGAALLEANKTCTALGSAVTCTSHGYSTGDDVFIGGRFVRITVTSANSFNAADRWGGTMNLTGATTCARVYTITSPYEAGDLFGLHYAQDSDVLTLVHPGYPAAELRRLGAVNWTLTAISFAPSAAVPTGVSVTPTIGTAGNESPQSYCVTAIDADGITESLASAVVSASNNLAVSGNYNTVAWSAVAGASAYNVFKSRGGAFGFIGQTSSLSIVDDNVLPDTTKTPPQDIYTLNAAADQYPSAVTYHEQRRWFAGSNANPQTVWATRNGTQANLTSSLPSQDDDGLQFRIQARQQNAIRHLLPLSDLIALTVGGEFRIFADNAPAITPSTLSTKSQGASGASNVQPCITSGSILYAQAQGSRVREMAYNWQNNAFASIDISILAPHLFDGHTVVDMAYSRAPVQLLWCVRSDGALLGMSYVPEQQVYGWHQHDTAGFFESVCVVSEGLEDALYALVRREVDGREVRYIERLKAAFTAAAIDEDEEDEDLDPLTLLQSRFIGASADDESYYHGGSPVQNGGTVAEGAFVVDNDNSAHPAVPSMLRYDMAAPLVPANSPLTFEFIAEWQETPNASNIPLARIKNDADSPFAAAHNFGYYVNDGTILFGSSTYYTTPTPMLGDVHLALVYSATGLRVYIAGSLVINVAGDYRPDAGAPRATRSQVDIGNYIGYSSGKTRFKIKGFRVRATEEYTGSSFTPPTEIPPP